MVTRCANPDCERTQLVARGRCQGCYAFLRRHGRDICRREMRLRQRRKPATCRICRYRPARARGRCVACYFWWRRHGEDRY